MIPLCITPVQELSAYWLVREGPGAQEEGELGWAGPCQAR